MDRFGKQKNIFITQPRQIGYQGPHITLQQYQILPQVSSAQKYVEEAEVLRAKPRLKVNSGRTKSTFRPPQLPSFVSFLFNQGKKIFLKRKISKNFLSILPILVLLKFGRLPDLESTMNSTVENLKNFKNTLVFYDNGILNFPLKLLQTKSDEKRSVWSDHENERRMNELENRINSTIEYLFQLEKRLEEEKKEKMKLMEEIESLSDQKNHELLHSPDFESLVEEAVSHSLPETLLQDKTGMADYALESAGAEILEHLTTSGLSTGNAMVKLWNIPIFYHTMSPRLAIQPCPSWKLLRFSWTTRKFGYQTSERYFCPKYNN